jgi:hypothetical protein
MINLTFGQGIAVIVVIAAAGMVGVMIGAFIVFRTKTAVPGENFIGGVPKGEAFTISDENAQESPEVPLMERTNSFLKTFIDRHTGGNQ